MRVLCNGELGRSYSLTALHELTMNATLCYLFDPLLRGGEIFYVSVLCGAVIEPSDATVLMSVTIT